MKPWEPVDRAALVLGLVSMVSAVFVFANGELEIVRVQVAVPSTQLHPVPLIAVAVNPAGNVSVTVTVPLLDAVPTFEITIV